MLTVDVVAFCFLATLVVAMCVGPRSLDANEPQPESPSQFRAIAIRYQVTNIDASVEFYTRHLGFKLEQKAGTAFARVSNGPMVLWLSGPASSGSRPLPDGRKQTPGGWNRLALQVDDLPASVAALKKSGLRFRNKIETGPGGSQIQLEDPDGNPIELFQPAAP